MEAARLPADGFDGGFQAGRGGFHERDHFVTPRRPDEREALRVRLLARRVRRWRARRLRWFFFSRRFLRRGRDERRPCRSITAGMGKKIRRILAALGPRDDAHRHRRCQRGEFCAQGFRACAAFRVVVQGEDDFLRGHFAQERRVVLRKPVRAVERHNAALARLPQCQRVEDRLGEDEARRVLRRASVQRRPVSARKVDVPRRVRR